MTPASVRHRPDALAKRFPGPSGRRGNTVLIRPGRSHVTRVIGSETVGFIVLLRVPCQEWDGRKLVAALSAEQRASIGPNDHVLAWQHHRAARPEILDLRPRL
jgi:hypothetical protein